MPDVNGDELLAEILSTHEVGGTFTSSTASSPEPEEADPPAASTKKADDGSHTQWAIGGNGKFVPVGSSAKRLPAGIYEPFADPDKWGLERLNVESDGIHILPDMATEEVLAEVNKFWAGEAKYRRHNLLYKRGIIMWGPPGGGKSVTIKILMNELVRRDGVVLVVNSVKLTNMLLKAIRRIEPTRNLIVVLEDIDEIIVHSGEAGVLSMLDGETNVDNVLYLATTNYPERLGARIINRPSRFDRRVYVGMPSAEARRAYLDKAAGGSLDSDTLDKWVKDTDEFSIAHMRELVAAVHCLEQPYEDVLHRLQEMSKQVKVEDEFKRSGVGFGTPAPTGFRFKSNRSN